MARLNEARLSMEVMETLRVEGNRIVTAEALAEIVSSAAERAAVMLGAAEGIRPHKLTLRPYRLGHHDFLVAKVRKELGESDFEALWDKGSQMLGDDAVRFTLEDSGLWYRMPSQGAGQTI